ncbi:MAG: hypothetical protein FWC19_09405 [Treponema sp.]|nr:hypothetical protein [Treponema sp.]MCL2273000.1 hypothetical protein [Treponema sp.]
MADTDTSKYTETLEQVLITRKDWLDRNELGKLKENLRMFHTSFASLYSIYLKKKLIDEDPYKQEAKITEIEVPESENFNETKRIEQLSIRLSNYDNMLDFLINFYQLGMDFLNLDRIKRIVGLVRYIDWTNFNPDSQFLMTKAVAEMTNLSKVGVDTLTLSIIGESCSRLSKMTSAIMATLKDLNTYYRESYKLSIRQKVTQSMSANEAVIDNIKKKMHSEMPGSPVYKELIDELIKEDYSSSGVDLRDTILNSLKTPAEKQKAAKPSVNYKNILLDGIQVIGGASASFTEISSKLDENQSILESRKKGFLHTIKELIRQITNAEPEEVIYTVEYMDQAKGATVKEKINFYQFRDDLDKKAKILSSFVRGSAYQKLAAMSEEQIISYLDRNIRDVQNMHRTLNSLDDFFKSNAVAEDRDKIKGFKPELSALKNNIVKANQFKFEYSAQKEEEDQMKRLGINPTTSPAPPAAPSS